MGSGCCSRERLVWAGYLSPSQSDVSVWFILNFQLTKIKDMRKKEIREEWGEFGNHLIQVQTQRLFTFVSNVTLGV